VFDTEFLILALLGLGITLDLAGVFNSSGSGQNDPNSNDDPISTKSGETWTGANDDDITALATAKVHAGGGDDNLDAFGDATVFGGAGDDDIVAKNAGPTYGEAGNDSINAYRGTSFGNDGNDTLFAYWDADVYGGRGKDLIDFSGTGTAYGGGGGDQLTTTFRGIGHGDGGNDTIYAGGEAWGDDGDDLFQIELASKTILSVYGGAGNDTMLGNGPITSTLYGGAGNDLMTSLDLVIHGDDGNDTLSSGYEGSTTLFGGNGNDVLSGDDALGGAGDDTISASFGTGYGEVGNDSIAAKTSYGGDGDDVLRLDAFQGEGFSSDAEAFGGDGNDTLYGFAFGTYESGGQKVLWGGEGDDVIRTFGGEMVDAGAGNDTIFAKSFDQAETMTVIVGAGADDLVMSLNPDQTYGDFGGDVLVKDFNPRTDQLALIVTPTDLATLEYSITPNLAGNYTEITFTQTSSTENLTYRFDGITSLSAANISLYANDAAVVSGQSYQTLA
jgi:Ca2+-binding RTX toxin-like protein